MDQKRALGRLLIEYEKHGQLIVAFDFDDTVFNTHERPGWEYNQVIELLRKVQPYAHIICWSASVPERYERGRTISHAKQSIKTPLGLFHMAERFMQTSISMTEPVLSQHIISLVFSLRRWRITRTEEYNGF